MNPYDLMLKLRDNKLLFRYLEVASVTLDSNKGWVINGQSEEGMTEIYITKGDCFRIVLPIYVPEFISFEVLQKLILSIQENINGIITIDMEYECLNYFVHVPVDKIIGEELTQALEEFFEERNEIKSGFNQLQQEYNKMRNAISQVMEKNNSEVAGGQVNPNSNNSIWNDMENIDKSFEDDEDEDDENKNDAPRT
jgi:hypothetical protein